MVKTKRKVRTKVGTVFLVASEQGLHGVFWREPSLPPTEVDSAQAKWLDQAERQIHEYLDGGRREFDLPLQLDGTVFQKKVWAELKKIPYGETRSYKQIATALNDPNACRAVGAANGRNPISIIVPCHRVINEGGKLGGYAGGLPVKELLLSLESKGCSIPT